MTNNAHPTPPPPAQLKSNCLSYAEVIAQSIAVIAPSTVPAAVMGLIFASAGNGTWLSILLGMTGLLFVSLNINQFARRSASPGSLYTYIVQGLGPTAGVMSGWGMLLAYTLTGMSTLCGFAIFTDIMLKDFGLHLPYAVLFAIGTAAACYVAYKDVQLSARMMLVLEGISIISIIVLGFIVWNSHGFAVDTQQLTLQHATPGGIFTGIILVVFGFSGFESSTSLGAEAKDPLRSIPRSIIQSTLFTGIFFLFMGYIIVLGYRSLPLNLATTQAPLEVFAAGTGLKPLIYIINIGVILSFFSCTLACINSTARIVFSMARHGIFHDALGEAHETNQTPYAAVFICALITFLVPTVLVGLTHVDVFNAQGYFGTLCSFGFLLVYILVSVAAPIYLKQIGSLRVRDIFYSVTAVIFMLMPLIASIGISGSSMMPPPEYPNNLFPWIFLAYMGVGFGWFIFQRLRIPNLIGAMKDSIETAQPASQEAAQ
ncbi:MAG TPA: APC family permease [Candidatus Methylacidiphilales bacterium]|nr:APC family permease [Candidatus Methylacidiphilales bacterium]